MASHYINKIKFADTYHLLDSGATHDANNRLSGTLGNFKANGVIAAEQGIFNKLIATSATIGDLDVNNLNANNATVVGLLDVRGELKTNSWSNSNIAAIEGNFYITPTLATDNSWDSRGITFSYTTPSSNTDSGWSISIVGTFNLNQVGATPIDAQDVQPQWSPGSEVLITGEVNAGNPTVPLGTLHGTISSIVSGAQANEYTITIVNVNDNLSETDILEEIGAHTYGYRNIKISLLKRKYGSNLYPVGILMSAQGRASKTFIDIYGGAYVSAEGALPGASTDYGGMAIPNVRIGNLNGLPNVRDNSFNDNNGCLPKGWGIYTDNGYFKGKVVADRGLIGGFDIGDNDLHNGSLGAATSVWMSTGTTGQAAIGGSTSQSSWAFTAGNKFGVTSAGDLYANHAHIAGAVHMESGTIDYGVIIGQADSVHISLSQEQIGFWKGSENNDINKTAYITNQYMYIPYTVVLNEMQVGTKPKYETVENPSGNPSEQKWYEIVNGEYILTTDTAIVSGKAYYEIKGDIPLWSWRKMDSGNLRLMWLGGEV